MLLAFVAGLIAFAWVWSNRGDDFYRAGPAAPTTGGPDYAPLPTPLPAGERDASGLVRPPADEPEEERPQLVEAPRPPPPAPTPPAAQAASAAPPATRPEPIAGSTPAPRYPPQAFRRGERGVVVVLAAIGPDGVPTSVSLAQSSGSRLLDRAALDAVRNWRFRPAMANGRPTTGNVAIPIEFNLE